MPQDPYLPIEDDEYWAAKDLDEFLPIMFEKVEDYFSGMQELGIMTLMRACYNFYYGLNEFSSEHEGSKVSFIDDNGNLIAVRTGHMRNILRHIILGATSNRISLGCKAVNSDAKSMAQTYAAKAIVEYFLYDQKYESKINSATERAALYSLGYLFLGIDPVSGELVVRAHSPMTVIRDLNNRDLDNQQWYIVLERRNKWDIAAEYDIEDIGDLTNNEPSEDYFVGFERLYDENDKDCVTLYHFYHKRTPALPDGRHVVAINSELALPLRKGSGEKRAIAPLPYPELPVDYLVPGEMLDSPMLGYSVVNDLVVHEKMMNTTLSTIHTHLKSFAKKFVAIPMGASVDSDADISTVFIKVPSGERPPTAIDMTDVSESLFKVFELEQKLMETISAISAPLRGQPDGQKSGSHSALLYTASLQFQQDLQQNRTYMIERFGTRLLKLLRNYEDRELIEQIVGKEILPYLQQFLADEEDLIDRVHVEEQPPMMRTMTGKMHIADMMMQYQLIKDPQDLMDVIDTGQITQLYTDSRTLKSAIQTENEFLLRPEELTLKEVQLVSYKDGRQYTVEVVPEVRALATDNHMAHIPSHLTLTTHPVSRRNVELVKKTYAHVAEHIWLSIHSNPYLLYGSGQKPMPEMPPPGAGGMIPPTGAGPLGPQQSSGGPPTPGSDRSVTPPGSPQLPAGGPIQPNPGSPDPEYPLPNMPGLPQVRNQ